MGKNIKQLTDDMHQFVSAKGWYLPESKRPQTPKNIAISLVLEANEVLEHFQWHENEINREQLEGELADVALYLFQLCQICNFDLEDAIDKKLKQNYEREWDQNAVK